MFVLARLLLLGFLLAATAACRTGPATPGDDIPVITSSDAAAVPVSTETALIIPSPTGSPAVAATTVTPHQTQTTTPVPVPSATATASTRDLSLTRENVFLYPMPEVTDGERVTFQVWPYVPEQVSSDEVQVQVFVDDQEVASGPLDQNNLAGEPSALFEWAWDTSGRAGEHKIRVILDGADQIQEGDEDVANNEVVLSILVGEAEGLTGGATWITAESTCCTVRAISGTAAYRDLPELLPQIDRAVAQASERLRERPEEKLQVYLIDRVIGQGGYASSVMVASYVDRPYAGSGLHELLVHEAVHIIDRQIAPQRISFLAEGVAVWASDGHYRPEDIEERMAILVQLDAYIPLAQLIDNFYPVQHEIGYLEAAAFVAYLVDQRGWPRFRDFYGDVTRDDAATLAGAVDVNLQRYYGKSLASMEAAWLDALALQSPDESAVIDLQTTIRYYDLMRRYQSRYDPAAHYLKAWLPYPQEVEVEGNTADFTRHPEAEVNLALETMLQSVDTAWREDDFLRANALLDSVERVLDSDGSFVDPLASSYLNIVQTARSQGFTVQRIMLNGDRASVLASSPGTLMLSELNLVLQGRDWQLLAN